MGTYLERSMHAFLEQQHQLRKQMDGLIDQTPWAMMNKLTERNMEMWQEFQKNLTGSLGQAPPGGRKQPGHGDKRER